MRFMERYGETNGLVLPRLVKLSYSNQRKFLILQCWQNYFPRILKFYISMVIKFLAEINLLNVKSS
jgi:hypothetical protein